MFLSGLKLFSLNGDVVKNLGRFVFIELII